MKRIFNILSLTLALNFLLVVGAIGWLYQSGHMDRSRAEEIRKIVFPPTSQPTTQPAATQPTTRPVLRLEELLAKQTGRSATEQVEFIRLTFDEKMAQMDRRQRELIDLQRQVDLAKMQVARDRSSLDEQRKQLDTSRQQANRLLSDKGFQDSLQMYNVMPSKQVKAIFMTLDEQTVINYLQAMPSRTASKVIKEFRSPEETARIQRILEKMRQTQVSVKDKE